MKNPRIREIRGFFFVSLNYYYYYWIIIIMIMIIDLSLSENKNRIMIFFGRAKKMPLAGQIGCYGKILKNI